MSAGDTLFTTRNGRKIKQAPHRSLWVIDPNGKVEATLGPELAEALRDFYESQDYLVIMRKSPRTEAGCEFEVIARNPHEAIRAAEAAHPKMLVAYVWPNHYRDFVQKGEQA